MKTIGLWAYQLAFAGMIYAAFGLRIDGAMSLLLFYVWVTSPCLFIALGLPKFAQEMAQKPHRPALHAFSAAISYALLALFAWHGKYFTALTWLVAVVSAKAIRQNVAKIRARQ